MNRFASAMKLAVSAGLVAYLVASLDGNLAREALARSISPHLAFVPLCFLAGLGVAAVRWRYVLKRCGVDLSTAEALLAYLVANFYGNVLPGVLGGDAVRVGSCVRRTRCDVTLASATVILERLCGLCAVASFPFLVMLLRPESVPEPWLVGRTTIVLVLCGASLGLLVLRFLLGRPNTQAEPRSPSVFTRALAVLRAQSIGALAWIVLLSATVQSIDIVATFVVAQSMDLGLPLASFFFVVPCVYIATVLPISLGGLGVREGTLVYLLGWFGVSVSDAVMLAFVVYLGRLVVGSLGGVLHVVDPLPLRVPAATGHHRENRG